jgi:hypothetical protein
MTALPTLAYLRRHALPAHFLSTLEAERSLGTPTFRQTTPSARPRLVATWHVGAEGRPVCRWCVERPSSVLSG